MTRTMHIQLTPSRLRASTRALTRALMVVLACSFGATACAQQTRPDEPPPVEEGPDRVARLSYTQGNVTLQGVGETEWSPAPVNRPLVPGDYLRTAADGRAEVQIDAAVVRLGAATNFSFLEMDEDTLRMRMSSGVAYLRVRDLAENEVLEVETPQATAAILRPGNYRLEVNDAGTTTLVKVSSGMLEARGGGQSMVVRAQQTATLTGTGRFAYTMGTLGAPDAFDEWSLERDRAIEQAWASESSKYVPNDVVGYEDLDGYGEWRSEPEYGYVWTPRVVSGWSPYRFGRYTYVSGWGWTWIADEPWGFAPFHYGNWVTIGGRWSWVPGGRHYHHRPGYRGGDHAWHIPRNPGRGISTREHPRNGLTNSGYRTIPNGSYRQPDGSYRGIRPGGERMQLPPSGGNGSAVPPPANAVPPPASSVPSMGTRPDSRGLRNQLPRNTFPRQESRVERGRIDRGGGDRGQGSVRMTPRPRMEMPRQESRPAPQPAPQSRPAPQQSQPQQAPRDNGSRSTRGHMHPR